MATPVQMHKWPLCAFYGADLGPGTHEAEEGRENMHENNASEQFFYLQGVLSTSDIDGDREDYPRAMRTHVPAVYDQHDEKLPPGRPRHRNRVEVGDPKDGNKIEPPLSLH